MANTHGFEVVAELTVNTLKELLKAAWKSGGDNSETGVIPEYINIPGPNIPAPVSFGPYEVASGHIQIPQEQLDLEMDTGINGVKIKLGTIIQVEIGNPPIDSARFFDMTADISVRTPIRILGENFELGADFTSMPADGVSVNITSGDPIASITKAAIEEYVHKKYEDGSIPHLIEDYPISFGVFSMKARIEFYDDPDDAVKTITVAPQDATHVKISIPTYIRFYDITGSYMGFSLATPMGISGTTVMVAQYTPTEDKITVDLPHATVELTNITPAAGAEGSNYTSNKNAASIVGYDLDNIIRQGFNSAAADLLQGHDPIVIEIPTLTQIEEFIEEKVKAELLYRHKIQIWKVVDPSETTPISEVRPKAIANALAICINPGAGADENAITYFVPASRDFAIATSAGKVQHEFNKKRNEQYGELPTTLTDKVEGKTVKLNSLNMSLETGHLNVYGEVTVVDLILDSIDVDASFSQKVTLSWADQSDGTQNLVHALDGDPDVSMSTWAQVLLVFIGIFTLGIVGGIIAAIILAVVESIASSIGGTVARNESGKVTGIGAWPTNLDAIGNIEARFVNPVIIESNGVVFGGSMLINSKYQLTSVDMARSHGPYTTSGNIPVLLNGGVDKPSSVPMWKTGDGRSFNIRNTSYRYGKRGLYIAKIQIQVTEEGGATTKHYASVRVKNVPPKVNFILDYITVKEGEEIELNGTFTDDNWLDTHEAWIDFGDNTKPQKATLTETNKEPQAKGTFSAKHAWCDNGVYQVRIKVIDSAGGFGADVMTVKVSNVAPEVITYKSMCVLKDQPVRLEAVFTDPGWCDTHVGTWDCGDGSLKMATIQEKHKSPHGIGIASVSNIYKCSGTFLAKVTVYDDDGGRGMACMHVKVNDLMNAGFENGFRYKLSEKERELTGKAVANEWHPFAEQVIVPDGDQKSNQNFRVTHFMADEFICREGQRAQGIKLEGNGIAGIRQTVCTNVGWDYEFTAFYHLPLTSDGVAMIGIDPAGGTLAASQKVVWVRSVPVNEWVHFSVRVTAKERSITCFAGVLQENGESEIFIDKAFLFMIQPCDPVSLISRSVKKDQEDSKIEDKADRTDLCECDNLLTGSANDTSLSAGTYKPSSQGVRFVDAENPVPGFRFDKLTYDKALGFLVKGGIHIATTFVKQMVGSAMDRVTPLLGRIKADK